MKLVLKYCSLLLALAIGVNAQGLECKVGQGKEIFMNCLLQKAKASNALKDINLLGALYVADKQYEEAILWYKKSAIEGDAKAAFFLGGIYDEALGMQSDKFSDKVKTYLLGKDEALLNNQKEAIKWYKKAAKANYDDAMPHLNEMMEKVYGKKDTVKLYQKEIKEGKDVYWNKRFLANFYFRINEYEQRIKILNELIEEYPKQKGKWLVSLGNTYMEKFLNNKEKEIEYYHQAAKYGNKTAMHNLGIYYGDKKDYKTAEMWFRKAGKPEMVCYMYKKIVKDKDKALECYIKEAESGKVYDTGRLAEFYEDKKEFNKAIELYKDIVKLGDSGAARNIAVIYKYDLKDNEKYIQWYKVAASMGDAKAIQLLSKKGKL